MSKTRKFLALRLYDLSRNCYHAGFEELDPETDQIIRVCNSVEEIHMAHHDSDLTHAEVAELPVIPDGTFALPFGHTAKQLEKQKSGDKYKRKIYSVDGQSSCIVDIYCVIQSFNVTNAGLQHAIKKLLCAGIRGKGDFDQDLNEAKDAIDRALVLEKVQ